MYREDLNRFRDEASNRGPGIPAELRLTVNFSSAGIMNFLFRDLLLQNSHHATSDDITCLKRRLVLPCFESFVRYTIPFPVDAHEMQGLELAIKLGLGT